MAALNNLHLEIPKTKKFISEQKSKLSKLLTTVSGANAIHISKLLLSLQGNYFETCFADRSISLVRCRYSQTKKTIDGFVCCLVMYTNEMSSFSNRIKIPSKRTAFASKMSTIVIART